MKIIDIINNKLNNNKKTLSFEVFPPKKGDLDLEKLYKTIDSLKSFNPDFISVTYGASGSNRKSNAQIASYIKNTAKIEALAHLTGGPSTPQDIDNIASELINNNIENILALRGDKPLNYEDEYCKHFKHATDLMNYLSKYDFDCACACYPEGHIECESLYDDLKYMKMKEDLGAKFFITQVFYDNQYYYRLVHEAKRFGINAPIIPGIMPVLNARNISNLKNMCGTAIPLEFRNMIEIYKDNPKLLKEFGINYAVYQIIDLIAKGAPGVHLYVMNNYKTAEEIYKRLENVFKELF